MAKSTIIAGRILSGGRAFDGWIEVRGRRIVDAGRGSPPSRPHHRSTAVAPGLCDLLVNGAGGMSVLDGGPALDNIDRALLDRGVTSYLPTVISSPDNVAERAVAAIAERTPDPASPVAGAHLEGPFIAKRFAGVHPKDVLRVPSAGVPEYYYSTAVRMVTLAPELPGAISLVDSLQQRGVVVSLGHTGASVEQAAAAAKAGASCVTHLFNAMGRLHHRKPNVAGWALASAGIRIGIIPDGVHIAPMMLSMVARAAGSRVVLVTDSTPVAALPSPPASGDRYRMGTVEVHLEGDQVVDGEGRLAGSAITLDEAVRRWVGFTGRSLAQSWAAASERPAGVIGIPTGLAPGAPADLVLIDGELSVKRVMKGGTWVR